MPIYRRSRPKSETYNLSPKHTKIYSTFNTTSIFVFDFIKYNRLLLLRLNQTHLYQIQTFYKYIDFDYFDSIKYIYICNQYFSCSGKQRNDIIFNASFLVIDKLFYMILWHSWWWLAIVTKEKINCNFYK